MSRMKPSRKKKFEEYREYMGNAFIRERTFLKTLDLVYGVTTYANKWLEDIDNKVPLPVLCYTTIIPVAESVQMFNGLTTKQRIALNAETIELFEDRDHAMMLLSQELSYRKSFFQNFTKDCDVDQPIEDVCIVDETGCLLASVKCCDNGEVDPQIDKDKDGGELSVWEESQEDDLVGADQRDPGMKSDSPTTFEKLDLVLYLASPYLNCEDKILLDVALENSEIRRSPFIKAIHLCRDGLRDAVADISVDIYTDIKKNRSNRTVGSPYIGWIFSNSYTADHHFPRTPGTLSLYGYGCICGTSLRHLYQRKSYKRLRGIARSLDDLPRRRSRTVLGYNFVHTLTM